jgi:hypothetical protein
MKPGFLQLIGRFEHPTIRTRPHLSLPAVLGSPLPPPMIILLLALQALLIIPITGRRVLPKRRDRFDLLTLTATFLRQCTGLPVDFHPAVMTVHVVAFFLEHTPLKFTERLDLLAPPTAKLLNLHEPKDLHAWQNNGNEI